MIKDIVVDLQLGEAGGPAGDYAVSLATTFAAHITGIAFVYDAIFPESAMGYISPAAVDKQREDNEAEAAAAVNRFAAAAARAGISAEPLTLNADLANIGSQFSRIARHFDFAVVGQAEPGKSAIQETIVESTLFDAGRPVIMVPYIQKAPLKLDNVMVCWDGSRPAARAIADALPLLKRAKRVEVVIITNDWGKQTEIEGADIGRHLAHHELNVEVERIAGGDVDIADVLLSHASDSDADFMVMGGYGHSRMREFVLGGATRGILRSMTVPTLMSH